ncbi:hypothetical protein GOODEAATRI_013110, partial [Goodea atripinnis]
FRVSVTVFLLSISSVEPFMKPGLDYALSLTGTQANLLCGCLSGLNVAEMAQLSPDLTGRSLAFITQIVQGFGPLLLPVWIGEL